LTTLLQHPVASAREDKGWTRQDLADASGLDVRTIRHIENGTRRYKTNESVAIALAHALGLKVTDLFTAEELSHLGRPARTGAPITTPARPTLLVCTVCSFELRRDKTCLNCAD
jgi:DNA-binding XRE family transcriptional regulator